MTDPIINVNEEGLIETLTPLVDEDPADTTEGVDGAIGEDEATPIGAGEVAEEDEEFVPGPDPADLPRDVREGDIGEFEPEEN